MQPSSCPGQFFVGPFSPCASSGIVWRLRLCSRHGMFRLPCRYFCPYSPCPMHETLFFCCVLRFRVMAGHCVTTSDASQFILFVLLALHSGGISLRNRTSRLRGFPADRSCVKGIARQGRSQDRDGAQNEDKEPEQYIGFRSISVFLNLCRSSLCGAGANLFTCIAASHLVSFLGIYVFVLPQHTLANTSSFPLVDAPEMLHLAATSLLLPFRQRTDDSSSSFSF